VRDAARFSRSVGAKLFLLVLLVLLLSFGVLGFLNVRLHRRHLEAARLGAATRLADVVRRSTSHSMLRNDRLALRHLVETIGKQPGIERLRIVDAKGHVAFSTRTDLPPGTRMLETATPIFNAPSCATAACHAHPASQKTLGMLELNLSLADEDANIRSATWQFIMQSGVAIFVTLLATGMFLWHVGRRLDEANEEITAWTHTLEDRVQHKTAELKRAHEQMIQAEKLTSLGKLAAVVAHEINNPLSGILTYAKLLRKWIDRGDDLQRHVVDMRDSLMLIESESRRCGDIVRSLLTFARVQPLNISDVDINRVALQCTKLVEHKLDLGNIALHLELGEHLPPIRGDAGQLEQLLLALVMNAIEAMPREGNLHIVTTSPDGESIVIRVEDNGVGIPQELLPRLFEPFTTTKEEGKGVGLGLAISRAIVDRHGGRIEVTSQAGRGTAFVITLPCGGQVCSTKDAFSSSTMSPAFAIR